MLDAIILAGGLGTRLEKTVPHLPKPLAPINGTPFLDLLLKQLALSGQVRQVILAIGHKADQIKERYKETTFLFSEETTLLGTAGGVKQALQLVETDQVWVLNGDSYFELSLHEMHLAHKKNGSDLTIACKEMEDASRYGSVLFNDDFRIKSFKEKESSKGCGWINGGIYLMKKDLLDSFNAFSLEKEVFPHLLNKHIFAYPSFGKFIDIGTEESYYRAQELLL